VKIHEPLVSEWNFMDPWSWSETSRSPGLSVKIH